MTAQVCEGWLSTCYVHMLINISPKHKLMFNGRKLITLKNARLNDNARGEKIRKKT